MQGPVVIAPPGRRVLVGVLGAAMVLGVAGCGPLAGGKSSAGPSGAGSSKSGGARAGAVSRGPAPAPAPAPANESGGACQLLDFAVIQRVTGLGFAVAAAAQHDATSTCVVQPRRTGYPDLTLSVTPTTADEKAYQAAAVPAGSAATTGLGRVGYSVAIAASGPAGPGVEVGWLAGNKRLMVLRYRSAPTAPPDEATALAPKLVDLAKEIDYTST